METSWVVMNGTSYHAGTSEKVIEELEKARAMDQRVRIFYGNVLTGKDWMEEHAVCGKIGRSAGEVKVPILLAREGSYGGASISTECIVRILRDGRETYRHPDYHQAALEITESTSPDALRPDYNWLVTAGGADTARFQSRNKAQRWVNFMEGRRMAP